MVVVAMSTGFSVDVHVWRENGEVVPLADFDSTIASDAFDYYLEARGYFRFAIQTMDDARKIEIEMRLGNTQIELTEITRD